MKDKVWFSSYQNITESRCTRHKGHLAIDYQGLLPLSTNNVTSSLLKNNPNLFIFPSIRCQWKAINTGDAAYHTRTRIIDASESIRLIHES
jgi:hypothetical protein